MGNCCVVEGAVDHWVYVKVGDRKPPMSDARLRAIVEDIDGKQSSILKLDCFSKNQFERGSQEVFEVGSQRCALWGVGKLDRCKLGLGKVGCVNRVGTFVQGRKTCWVQFYKLL